MKGSLVVVAFFCAGCMIGAVNNFQYDMHSVSMYVLYALMLQVGISIGSNKKLKELIKSLRLKMLHSTDGYHCGNLAFLGTGQSAIKPMECIRLYGGGQLALPIIHCPPF